MKSSVDSTTYRKPIKAKHVKKAQLVKDNERSLIQNVVVSFVR